MLELHCCSSENLSYCFVKKKTYATSNLKEVFACSSCQYNIIIIKHSERALPNKNNKHKSPSSLNSSLKLEVARLSNWSRLMDIVPIRFWKFQRSFTKLVNNIEFEASKHKSKDNFDFQFRHFHSCARMTSCDVKFISS